MGALYDPRFIATDDDGTRLGGATLTVYLAGTTTLATLYSDAALSSPLSNPVTADSAGVLPQIFLTEGTNCDATLKTSAGVTVRSYEDIEALAADGGDISRTLTDNTRFVVRGSGGVVYIEAGDASPDNTGGTMRIGGWNGTELDLLTLDGPTNVDSDDFTVNGKKIAAVVTTEATEFSAVSQIAIPLTEQPDGVRMWEIEIWDFVQSANANVNWRISVNGGGSYVDSAGYNSAYYVWGSTVNSSLSATSGQIGPHLRGDTKKPGRILIRVVTPDSGSDATHVSGEMAGIGAGGSYQVVQFTGLGPVDLSPARATHLAILPASGTITGKYLVRAMRGTGDA